MSEIVSFQNYLPAARYDSVPWTQALIEEADTSTGTWATIDTITFDVPDPDPADPQERSFTTPNGTAPDLWYRVTFLDDFDGTSMPTTAFQNTGVASQPYATTDDLFRVLKVRTPTDDQTVAAQGDLDTATLEINAELDWADDHTPATSDQLDLMKNVCINRAADLWRHRESIPGVLGGLDDVMPTAPGRYSFARYVAMLSPLKDQWGVS
jgi:hypothetical protein